MMIKRVLVDGRSPHRHGLVKEDELSKHQSVCVYRNLLLVGRGNSGSNEGCRLLSPFL
jgi:hypothetical protein